LWSLAEIEVYDLGSEVAGDLVRCFFASLESHSEKRVQQLWARWGSTEGNLRVHGIFQVEGHRKSSNDDTEPLNLENTLWIVHSFVLMQNYVSNTVVATGTAYLQCLSFVRLSTWDSQRLHGQKEISVWIVALNIHFSIKPLMETLSLDAWFTQAKTHERLWTLPSRVTRWDWSIKNSASV